MNIYILRYSLFGIAGDQRGRLYFLLKFLIVVTLAVQETSNKSDAWLHFMDYW